MSWLCTSKLCRPVLVQFHPVLHNNIFWCHPVQVQNGEGGAVPEEGGPGPSLKPVQEPMGEVCQVVSGAAWQQGAVPGGGDQVAAAAAGGAGVHAGNSLERNSSLAPCWVSFYFVCWLMGWGYLTLWYWYLVLWDTRQMAMWQCIEQKFSVICRVQWISADSDSVSGNPLYIL